MKLPLHARRLDGKAMNTAHLRTATVGLAALIPSLCLLTGCTQVSAPSPTPPVASEQTPIPAPAPQAPMAEPAMAPSGEITESSTVYLRETPPPPVRLRIIERGGLPPMGRIVLVGEAPPPPREEVRAPRPSNGEHHVWLPGHWRYYGGRYIWISGHWALPPRPHATYIAPHWDLRGEAHVFVEGYWQM